MSLLCRSSHIEARDHYPAIMLYLADVISQLHVCKCFYLQGGCKEEGIVGLPVWEIWSTQGTGTIANS